ncbi:MAG TPA: hypothetical protein VJ770_08640 [Stellaceae bacterium]|nr:hypothetical protein [Stellaceae bacterium]
MIATLWEVPVKCVTMLATSEGQWVFEDSPEFRAALGDPDPNPDYDAALFAVKNLGFIRLEMPSRSVIELELHPQNVTLPALLAVQEQLQSSRINLFRIRYFDTAWRSELAFSAERAMARLAELCAPALTVPSSERFVTEPIDFALMYKEPGNPFRPLIQKWRMAFGCFDASVISFAIHHNLLSRMMVIGLSPKATDPVFRFIGDGFPWTNDDYKISAIGSKIEDQPDKEYGNWVSEFYKFTARSGQPLCDRVTAAIAGWRGTGNTQVTRYERLLLPWKTPSAETLVTLFSLPLGNRLTPAEPRVHSARQLVKSS